MNFRIVDKLQKSAEKSRGQSMLEFAIVLPFLLAIIFGLFEFSRLLFIYSSVTMASREAARFGSAAGTPPSYLDCDGIRNSAKSFGVLAGIQDDDITISYDDGSSVISASCPPTENSITSGDRILVDVAVNYAPVVPIPGIPGFEVGAQTARTILEDIAVGEGP